MATKEEQPANERNRIADLREEIMIDASLAVIAHLAEWGMVLSVVLAILALATAVATGFDCRNLSREKRKLMQR